MKYSYTWLPYVSVKVLLSWESVLQHFGMWLLKSLSIKARLTYIFVAKDLKKPFMKTK